MPYRKDNKSEQNTAKQKSKKNAVQKRKQIGTKYGKTKVEREMPYRRENKSNKVRQNKSQREMPYCIFQASLISTAKHCNEKNAVSWKTE